MKALKIANTIALLIPVVLACLSVFEQGLMLFSIISLIATGAIQTLVGVAFWIKNKQNRLIPFYFAISVLFFLFAFGIHKFDLDDVFTFQFWILPGFLCVYLSWIIYTSEPFSIEKQK